MRVRNAVDLDLGAVESLLLAAKLPLDGVSENFSRFMVADDDGRIIGAIGLEKFGSAALLRSAIVSSEYRGKGTGSRLVHRALERASEDGIEEVYLLTTAAENYFAGFGFTRVARSAVPDAVKMSLEFRGACPESAVVMTREIAGQSMARR